MACAASRLKPMRAPLTAAIHDEFADVLAALWVAQSERMDLAMTVVQFHYP